MDLISKEKIKKNLKSIDILKNKFKIKYENYDNKCNEEIFKKITKRYRKYN